MDPNDDDLALMAELRRLDKTKGGPIPIAALSAELQEAFEDAHMGAACPVIDRQLCIQPTDWTRFRHRQEQEAMQRMRERSLEAAVIGPSPDALAQAPLLSRWIAIETREANGAMLIGSAPDHPVCEGTLIATSRLCGIAEDGSWARTTSRWYRLEHPATLEEILQRHAKESHGVPVVPLKLWQALAIAAREQEDVISW